MDNFDNWDDIDLSDVVDEPVENEGTEEPEADQPTETEVQQEPETEEVTADTFTLKYMDEEKSVSREEIVPLAQKGMDYDRIRGKLNDAEEKLKQFDQTVSENSSLKETLHWLEEMANEQHMTVDEMIDATRANVMSRQTGQSLDVVKGIIANQREARRLEMEKAKLGTQKETASKRDADIQQFLSAYPDFKDPKDIPSEVWDAVNKGETLLSAYRTYENKQLREELQKVKAEADAKIQKEKNKSRSTGSQTANETKTDDWFDSLWNDGT